ncbi:hypothetical protein X975_14228, partial [Stegodyphus mimosarum]
MSNFSQSVAENAQLLITKTLLGNYLFLCHNTFRPLSTYHLQGEAFWSSADC